MPPPNVRRRRSSPTLRSRSWRTPECTASPTARSTAGPAFRRTASNYFRNREALLVAAAERVGELHFAGMDAAAATHRPASGSSSRRST